MFFPTTNILTNSHFIKFIILSFFFFKHALSIWEYFRVRKLLGWVAGAIAMGIICYSIELFRPWTGLVVTALLGYGFYSTLTSDGKYLRYAKWVLIFGVGAAGILNGLPVIAGKIFGQVSVSENNFITFLADYKMDEQPLVTIIILVLTFGLSAFLIYKDQEGE